MNVRAMQIVLKNLTISATTGGTLTGDQLVSSVPQQVSAIQISLMRKKNIKLFAKELLEMNAKQIWIAIK